MMYYICQLSPSFFPLSFCVLSFPVDRFNDGPIDGEYDWVNPAQMALVVESWQKQDNE